MIKLFLRFGKHAVHIITFYEVKLLRRRTINVVKESEQLLSYMYYSGAPRVYFNRFLHMSPSLLVHVGSPVAK